MSKRKEDTVFSYCITEFPKKLLYISVNTVFSITKCLLLIIFIPVLFVYKKFNKEYYLEFKANLFKIYERMDNYTENNFDKCVDD